VHVVATPTENSEAGREPVEFDAVVRIDTPGEADYYRNGGILQYVLRSLV
jgi:aconitate hydratase